MPIAITKIKATFSMISFLLVNLKAVAVRVKKDYQSIPAPDRKVF